MVLKPNFLLKLSARVITSTHPSHRIAASYKTAVPRGHFTAGHLSPTKAYMQSTHKILMPCVTAAVAVILAMPAKPQEPPPQGPVIQPQVDAVNLCAPVR